MTPVKSKNSGMMRVFLLLTLAAMVLLLCSYAVITLLLQVQVKKASVETAGRLFRQGRQNLDSYEKSIDRLSVLLSNDGTIVSYIDAENFGERWQYDQPVKELVTDYMTMIPSMVGVMLCDQDGEITFASGKTFIGKTDFPLTKRYNYSDRIENTADDAAGGEFFQVAVPMFTEKGVRNGGLSGTILLTMQTDEIQEIVDGILINEQSAAAIVDRNGKVIVQSGQWEPGLWEKIASGEEEDHLNIHYRNSQMEWTLVSTTPYSSLLHSTSMVNTIVMVSYLVLSAILATVLFLIYHQIFRPLVRQINFMIHFRQNTNERIQVIGRYEISELAVRMNHMLDDIDELNAKMLEEKQKNLELKYAKKETEILAYKSQINPHFLYNTLSCIHGMALYHGEREIAEVTRSLSKLYQYNVKGKDMVTAREAIRNLQEYACIIRYRFNQRIQIEAFAMDDAMLTKMPKMILQPLVENAVQHGLEPRAEGGRTVTEIRRDGNMLHIEVSDDGVGMAEDALKDVRIRLEEIRRGESRTDAASGIGILNVYRRLLLYYPESVGLSILSTKDKGTRITIVFPIEGEEENV